MSITSDLEQILSARYGKDVRQAIHDSIEEGYNIAVQAEGKATTAQDSASASASASAQSSASALQSAQLAEQYKNEAFSGTPTGYEALVEKVNSIYKETASQYAIIGSSEGSALAHTIYGMSVQDGTPTPSVPVEIQSAKANYLISNENLIRFPYNGARTVTSNGITYTYDDDGTIHLNGTCTEVEAYFPINRYEHTLKYLNEIYTKTNRVKVAIYADEIIDATAVKLGIYLYDKNNNLYWGAAQVSAKTPLLVAFRYNNGEYYKHIVYIRVPVGTTLNDFKLRPKLVFAYGDTSEQATANVIAKAKEPYVRGEHTDVTTDLTLRAIEVTSSVDYNLERDGKYYIADTIDWSEDEGYEITRRIKRDVFDGSDDEVINLWNNTSGSTQRRFSIKLSSSPKFITNASGIVERWQGIANYLQKAPSSSSMNYEFGYYAFQCITPNSDYRFNVYDYMTSPRFSSVTEIKTWLASNNLVVDYILATPTTEPITSEQAQALLSLKTYDEATSISAIGDIEPSLDLEYSKDRNTALALTGHNLAHKNALKLNDINTALIELGGN